MSYYKYNTKSSKSRDSSDYDHSDASSDIEDDSTSTDSDDMLFSNGKVRKTRRSKVTPGSGSIGKGKGKFARSNSDIDDQDSLPTWCCEIPDRRFTGVTGLTSEMDDCHTPADFFYKVLSAVDIWQIVMDNTNAYARSKDSDFVTTLQELKFYVGALIAMGVAPREHLADYFSACPFLGVADIRDTMSLKRFQLISQFFHPSDLENADISERTSKIQPMIKILESQHKYFKPGQDLSIEEGTIESQGKVSLRQYMPVKLSKYGVKFFSCFDVVTGYCLRLFVYFGKDERSVDCQGFIFNIFNFLLSRYLLSNYICYTDDSYTCIKLAIHLRQHDTHLVATSSTNSKGLHIPKNRSLDKNQNVKLDKSDGTTVCRWWDKRNVYALSSIRDGKDSRRRSGDHTNPDAINDYHSFMGGVDMTELLRCYIKPASPSKKYWKTCFRGLLNICAVNAYICYCEINPNLLQLRDFKLQLAKSMMSGYNGRKRALLPLNFANHVSDRSVFKRRCVNCIKNKVKTNKNYAIRTSYYCKTCNVYLCAQPDKTCFFDYHNNEH